MKKTITTGLKSLLLVTIGLWSISIHAAIHYVAPSGSSAWSGQTVYNDIASAITAASSGDEIWIAEGEYLIGSGGINYNVAKSLKFYGGFAATETLITERAKVVDGEEWEFQHPTILKMTAGSTCVWVNNSTITATFDGITFDGDNISGTRGIGVNSATEVTISRCIIKNNNTGAANGAGILGMKKIIVDNCWIDHNISSKPSSSAKWGSGICIASANSSVKNSLISNNTKTGDNGGGIGVDNVAGVVISNCRIIDNSTTHNGGGICAYRLDDIHNCLIEGNSAASSGGGIYHRAYSGSGIIYNSIFVNNTATGTGGGLYFHVQSNICNVKTYNCVIANNTGSDAGVSYANATTTPAQMINCILYDNKNSGNVVSNVAVAGTNTVFKNNILDNATITNLTQTSCIIETDPAKLFTNISANDFTPPATGFSGLEMGDATGLTFADNKDYAGAARIQGPAIEIGAYEFALAEQVVNLTVGAGIASTTPATITTATTGNPLTISFTLQSSYHTPYVSVNNVKYSLTESEGTYSFSIASVDETQNISISAFATNVVPVTEDTWVDNNSASTSYYTAKYLDTRNTYSSYSNRRAYLRFNLPANIRSNYNKVELKLYNGAATDRDNNNVSVRTVSTTISELADFSALTWTMSGAEAASYDGTEIAIFSPVVMKATAENTEITANISDYVINTLSGVDVVNVQFATDTDGYIHLKSLENGNANYVPVLVFSTDVSTGNYSLENKVNVYYQNAKLKINNLKQSERLQITDMFGRKVYEEILNDESNTVNCTLAKGIYFVKVGTQTVKLLVNN